MCQENPKAKRPLGFLGTIFSWKFARIFHQAQTVHSWPQKLMALVSRWAMTGITIIELVTAVRNYLLNKQLSNVLKVKMYSVPHLTFFRQLVNSTIRQLRIWFSIRRKPQNCLPKTKKLRINHKVVYQKSLHFVAQTTFLFT